MKLIQPYPDHSCPLTVPEKVRIVPPVPVYYVRFRYPHHSLPSGYDRLCDYVRGGEVRLSRGSYWLGETLLRVPIRLMTKLDGHFEYSRYDAILELDVIRHFLRHHNSIYHYVYGEKSYRHLSGFAGHNGNKIVLTVHHPASHYSWLFRSTRHFRKADKVTVVSKSQIPFMESIVGAGKVAWVPYAVDTDYFQPRPIQRSGGLKRCICVGRHERDFDLLRDVSMAVVEARDDTEFLIVANDERCVRIAAQHSRIRCERRLSEDEYRAAIQDSDLLVLPLHESTTNTAVLEAMACGVPVITNRGGIEDYLDPQSSRVCPVADVDAMTSATLELLDDEALRMRMSKAARWQAENFSWPETARKMVSLYQQMME